jgi:hypothetical protein
LNFAVARFQKCSVLNRLTQQCATDFPPELQEGIMAAPKNDKFKDYARYAEHCLNMTAVTTDQELRRVQREMALEWLRLADTVRRPRRSKQMQMG